MDQISYKTSKIHFNKEILCLELMAQMEVNNTIYVIIMVKSILDKALRTHH